MSRSARIVAIAVATLGTFALPGCWVDRTPNAEAASVDVPASAAVPDAQESPPDAHLPKYDAEGGLLRPADWESWVMVGASIGLDYEGEGQPRLVGDPGMFHNVFMQPWAYRHFMETGEFPEQTMFVLAFYEASQEADPAQRGFYSGELSGSMEIHLKQAGAHETGWLFYAYAGDREAGTAVPTDAACYTCHAERTDYDNVFVQFYPTLRRRMESGVTGGG